MYTWQVGITLFMRLINLWLITFLMTLVSLWIELICNIFITPCCLFIAYTSGHVSSMLLVFSCI